MHDTHPNAAADLAAFARHGDRQALERCLAACLQPAYRQAYALLGTHADAADASQEALLQLTRSAGRYDPSRPLGPWLARHVADACLRLRRADGRRRRREREVMAMQETQTALPEGVDEEAVRLAVAELSQRDQRLISLHYFAGLSQAECAEALGIKENACTVALHRARGRLKKLLARHGVAAGLAALPALAQAAPVAPAALLPHVVATCSAGSLPATTIPMTIMQHGAWFMHTHPIITALLLTVSCSLPFIPAVVNAADDAPPGGEAAESGWSPEAAALLPLLDERMPIRAAGDAAGLRGLLSRCSLGRLLVERDLLQRWEREMIRLQAWDENNDLAFYHRLPRDGEGFVMQADARRDGRPRYMIGIDGGGHESVFRLRDPRDAPAIGAFEIWRDRDSNLVARRGDQHVLLVGPDDLAATLLGERRDPPARWQSAPLWLELDAGPIIARYDASLGGAATNPMDLPMDLYLGADWQATKPSLRVLLDEDDGALLLHGEVDDLGTAGPWLAALLAMDYLLPGDLPDVPLSFRAPTMLPAADPQALGELRLGVVLPENLPSALERSFVSLGLSRLPAVWNGELMLRLREGPMLPMADLVIGCQADDAPFGEQVVALLADFNPTSVDVPAGYGRAWQCFTPLGPVTVAQADDRLVLSLGGDLQALLGSSADEAALSVDVDLPRLGKRWLPMLWSMLPERFDGVMLTDHRLNPLLSALASQAGRIEGEAVRQQVDAWLGDQGDPMRLFEYLSIFRKPDGGRQFVYRTDEGFVWVDRWLQADPSRTIDSQELERRLQGMTHAGGATLEALKNHPRGPVPRLLRDELLPAPLELAEHLPRYRLRWWQEGRRQRFEERGLPLAGALCAAAAVALTEADPEVEVHGYRQDQERMARFTRHRDRLAQLDRVVELLKGGAEAADLVTRLDAAQRVALGLPADADAAAIAAHGRWYPPDFPTLQVTMLTRYEELDGVTRIHIVGTVPRWAVPIESGWWAVMTDYGTGIVAEQEVPEPPQMVDF